MKKPANKLPADIWQQTADSARQFLDRVPFIFLLRLQQDLKRAGRADPDAAAQADALERHINRIGCTDIEALALAWAITNDIRFCGSPSVQ